ncbi:MAG: hypothetical protein JW787_10785 [Sedimentisphaerales bacterium]|nr:hypothetical protein [Sedimentisphaerales bacterium]
MAINEELDFLVSRVSKVRRWLAAIAVLKTAAICLLFACFYIGGYILLDHKLNFGALGRLFAFALLIAATSILLYKLSRLLLVQISYTNAANFIENNNSFNQQLVAAMEYYENTADYPYSKALAEQLILRVNKDSESFRFDSVVEKWRGYALAVSVFLGMSIVGLYIQHNLSFLKTYLIRLAVPFSSVEPVSATSLKPITGDIVSEPETMIVMAAEINGRIPEKGQLIITPAAQDSNNQEIQLHPIVESEKEPKFEISEFFPEKGQFKYRFETGQVQTQWQNIDIRETPQIKSITAEIKLPKNISDDNILKNYTEQIKNNKLELIKNSDVTLHIESTSSLSEIELTEPSGLSKKNQINGESTFTHTFNANMEGSVEFHLTDDKGMKSKNVTALKILLKKDNPPQFKLISPDGDYLATSVSSIPIEFEITDDFGLSSAKFIAEFPKDKAISLDIPVKSDSNEARFSHLLELEQYNLEVGDSIMFHAQAEDIKTAVSTEKNAAGSEIYFIEIRPYHQIWHLKPGGGKSNIPGAIAEDLMTLLEYTRAIVKNTSIIESKTNIHSDDRTKLDSINQDVEYCINLLTALRDNPDNNFTDAHKIVLNQILANYDKASGYLERYDASEALSAEKEAYRILRKFVLELENEYSPPESGTTVPQETPEKSELRASIQPPEIEEERLEDELEKAQNEIEKLKQEQQELKKDLEKVAKQQKETNERAKANSQAEDQGKGSEQGESQGQGKGGEGQGKGGEGQGKGSEQSESQGQGKGGEGQGKGSEQSESQEQGKGGEGQGKGSEQSESQGQGKGGEGQGKGSEQSESQGQGKGAEGQGKGSKQGESQEQESTNQTIADAQLKMLQARQAELQRNVSQLQQKLDTISQNSETNISKVSNETQEHLSEALEHMEQINKKMDEMRYLPEKFNEQTNETVEMMDLASQKLESADNAIEKGLQGSQESQLAQKLMENAERLTKDAESLDEGLTELEREQMLALLEAAIRLLESNASAHWSTAGQGGDNRNPGSHVLTKGGAGKADTPREISRQFWSLAFELEKRKEQPIEDEPSDLRFFEIENNFFENAAKYNTGVSEK